MVWRRGPNQNYGPKFWFGLVLAQNARFHLERKAIQRSKDNQARLLLQPSAFRAFRALLEFLPLQRRTLLAFHRRESRKSSRRCVTFGALYWLPTSFARAFRVRRVAATRLRSPGMLSCLTTSATPAPTMGLILLSSAWVSPPISIAYCRYRCGPAAGTARTGG